MIRNIIIKKYHSKIQRKPDEQGKSIEEEIRQATASKSPIESIAPEIYTPLKDGVLPQYDIRTDRQEIALEATEKMNKSEILHSDETPQNAEIENIEPQNKD